MPWPVHPNGLLGAQGDEDSYRIARSLRFNSADSAYLNRTPSSAGNRKTWTWSGWVKRVDAVDFVLLGAGSIASGAGAADNRFLFSFNPSTSNFEVINSVSATQTYLRTSNAVYRDISSWMHIVVAFDTTQATANNRLKIYINGSEITSFSAINNLAQNTDGYVNNTVPHQIGRNFANPSTTHNGYLSEINFIDGQALTASSFGETDPITGRWKAKAYSGTYGTNGFYLKFADNIGTTSTTLGKDSSGNGNNWTPNNFSVTAGAGNDSLVDSPTNYGADTGVGGEVRGNYCTLNPLAISGGTLANGNLDYTASNVLRSVVGTIGVISGKWYWEVRANLTDATQGGVVGVTTNAEKLISDVTYVGGNSTSYSIYQANGNKYNNGSLTSYGSSFLTSGDIVMVALDMSSGKVWFGLNGTWAASGNPSSGTNEAFSGLSGTVLPAVGMASGTVNYNTDFSCNFGQRPFAYTAPSGFKALCTQNLTQPTIQKPSKFMDALAYTGTGASNSISSLGFSPDIVWIKNRGTTTSHSIYDTTRGAQKQLSSDTTGDEITSSTGLTSFDADGFTIGNSTLVNTSGTQYVAWAWDESNQAGIDIVSYTGNGANRTISHNLGVAPKMIIVKARTTAGADQGWPVWHTSIANTTYLSLNATSASASGTDYWNSTSPTSSVFSVGTNAAVNANNDTYIAYVFSEIDGFSKFGSYTGTGTTDGAFVWCGFRPRYLLIKSSTDGVNGQWAIIDTARSDANANAVIVQANQSNAETSYTGYIDILSNGFKLRNTIAGSWTNTNGATYIFAAFAESPFKYARAR